MSAVDTTAGSAEQVLAASSDCVIVKLKRPEGYEDVHPELVLIDANIHPAFEPELVAAFSAMGDEGKTKPLTDEQIDVLYVSKVAGKGPFSGIRAAFHAMVRTIEAAHGIASATDVPAIPSPATATPAAGSGE
ncbi:MAG: hypothetical protein JWR07_1952 [Nevskia sp.]|nr:hypothetical protein [Nevskia sp.]